MDAKVSNRMASGGGQEHSIFFIKKPLGDQRRTG